MQLKNKLKIKPYLGLTIINISQYYFIREEVLPSTFIAFFMGVVLNQYILGMLVSSMTGIEENTSLIPTWMLGILKPLTLFGAFYVALDQSIENVLIFLEIYIFQLIILVISIKRIVKKN
jgi:hypothetical protein